MGEIVMQCSEEHFIPFIRCNFGKDFSDCDVDCDGRLMFEKGLYCCGCNMVY